MEKETAFPIGKLLKLVTAVGQGCAACFDVLFSASYPCALGTCKYIGKEVVLLYDILFGRCLAVVPWCRDCACNIAVSLLLIVDVALVYAHKVGKYVKMVCIVVAAVDIGHSVYYCSS